ncbi:hypothetical protein C7K70_15270 [Aeromonas hydrophila]|nr:hypothetical protein C7K70_15270 [Aeromonas hydrophila]
MHAMQMDCITALRGNTSSIAMIKIYLILTVRFPGLIQQLMKYVKSLMVRLSDLMLTSTKQIKSLMGK